MSKGDDLGCGCLLFGALVVVFFGLIVPLCIVTWRWALR